MIGFVRGNGRFVAIAAIVVLLVAANVVLMMQWRSATDSRAQAENDKLVAETNLKVTQAQYDVDGLRSEEAALKGGPEFPTKLPIVDLSVFIAERAALSRVTIKEIGPVAPVGTENLGGKRYPVYETKVTAAGGLSDIIAFIKSIEAGAFSSIEVRDVSGKKGEGATWEGKFTVAVISQR